MLIKQNNLEDLTKGVLYHGPDILKHTPANLDELKNYANRIFDERLNYPIPTDKVNPENWFIPNDYKNMDIEGFLVDQCPKENYDRLVREIELYRKHNMIPVLKAMKYVVDTLKENNIVWGVGRGSSVASYVLYLIGVHRIDSVKYKLPIEEFFKEI